MVIICIATSMHCINHARNPPILYSPGWKFTKASLQRANKDYCLAIHCNTCKMKLCSQTSSTVFSSQRRHSLCARSTNNLPIIATCMVSAADQMSDSEVVPHLRALTPLANSLHAGKQLVCSLPYLHRISSASIAATRHYRNHVLPSGTCSAASPPQH